MEIKLFIAGLLAISCFLVAFLLVKLFILKYRINNLVRENKWLSRDGRRYDFLSQTEPNLALKYIVKFQDGDLNDVIIKKIRNLVKYFLGDAKRVHQIHHAFAAMKGEAANICQQILCAEFKAKGISWMVSVYVDICLVFNEAYKNTMASLITKSCTTGFIADFYKASALRLQNDLRMNYLSDEQKMFIKKDIEECLDISRVHKMKSGTVFVN